MLLHDGDFGRRLLCRQRRGHPCIGEGPGAQANDDVAGAVQGEHADGKLPPCVVAEVCIAAQDGVRHIAVSAWELHWGLPHRHRAVPSLNTHSEVFSYESGRVAVPVDYLAMQGMDAHTSISGKRPVSEVMQVMRKFTETDVRFLVGNGLHVPTVSAWFLYVFANSCRREIPRVEPLLQSMKQGGDSEADADEESLQLRSAAELSTME